jgi:hypothetical protein
LTNRRYTTAVRVSKRTLDLAIVAVFTSLLFVPFMGKAFHNDEPSNLAAAAHIAQDPFHPYRFDYTWFGRTLPYAATSNNPPLFHYLLALALKFVGDREFFLRLCFLPLDLLAALSLYLIAARDLKRPLMPTLIVVAGPAYLINLGHLMGEKAAAAFGFAGLALLLDGETTDPLRFFGSAVLLDAALLCKYSAALFLIPAAAVLLAAKTKPRRVLVYLAVAGAGLAAYLGWDVVSRGTALSATLETLSQTARLPTAAPSHRLRALLAFTAGCGAATAAWPFFARRPSSKAWAALALGAALLFGPWLDLGPAVRPLDRLTGAALAAAAAWGLCVLCFERPRGWSLWSSWAASALAASAAYWSVTSRLILFALPPLAFAWAALLEDRISEAGLRRLYAVSLALTLALSAGLAATDYRYAAAQKDFALSLQRDYLARGRRVWYTGYMGLQYYLSRAGGRGLDSARGGWDLARPGDAVAVLKINSTGLRPNRPLKANTLTYDVDGEIPLRLFNGWGGEAAFYSSTWGFLPFALSREPLEEFTVVELQ